MALNRTPANVLGATYLLTSAPQSEKSKASVLEQKLKTKINPTRYGDWEKKGRCIDF